MVLRCSLAIQGGTRHKDMKKIYTIYTGIHLQIHADTDKCVPSSPNNDVSGLGVTWASSVQSCCYDAISLPVLSKLSCKTVASLGVCNGG